MISGSAFDFEVFHSQLADQESVLAKTGSVLAIHDCGPEQIRVELLNLDSLFAPVPNLFRNSSYPPRGSAALQDCTAIKKCRDIRQE